jgi:hypothetical protein
MIGSLAVNTGTLLLGTTITTASSSTTTVAANATLGLNSFNLNTGNLTVNGTLSGTGQVNATGVFSGSGTVGASAGISSAGTLAPGGLNSVGTLKLAAASGALTLASSDKATFDISSSTAGGYDTVNLNGAAINYAGTLVLNFTYAPDMSGVATTYTLFSGEGAVTGSFPALNISSNLNPGYTFSFDTSGGAGVLTVTPEPTSLAMVGGTGLFMLRRRRRSRRVMSS